MHGAFVEEGIFIYPCGRLGGVGRNEEGFSHAITVKEDKHYLIIINFLSCHKTINDNVTYISQLR